MLGAHELIEPKSASTSQTVCGSAAMVRLRSMAATVTRYAKKHALMQFCANRRRRLNDQDSKSALRAGFVGHDVERQLHRVVAFTDKSGGQLHPLAVDIAGR